LDLLHGELFSGESNVGPHKQILFSGLSTDKKKAIADLALSFIKLPVHYAIPVDS